MWGRLIIILSLIVASLAAAVPDLASAQDEPVRYGDYCHTSGELVDTVGDVWMLPESMWDCSGSSPGLEPERTYLRFTLNNAGEEPDTFVLRRTFLQAVHVVVLDADGTARSQSFAPAELMRAGPNDTVQMPLPEVTEDSRHVVIAIDKPTHRIAFASAQLMRQGNGSSPDMLRDLIIKSMLVGLLLMPLLFNLIIFHVLRERFVLWHAVLTSFLAAHIFSLSGMLNQFWAVNYNHQIQLQIVLFGGCICSALMFARSMTEKENLNPKLRPALLYSAIWVAEIAIVQASFPFIWRTIKTDVFYAAFIPVLAVILWYIFDALRNGSRAARFVALGWLPIILLGLSRLLGQLTPWFPATDAMQLLQFGAVLQVMTTALAISDKFMIIRNRADTERARIDHLEEIVERDPLTGLFNRRAIEGRFAQLREVGFETFAVLDLDHFKGINDKYGHNVGDEVLKEAAEVLLSDADSIPIRMGGEEFMLLLRGDTAEGRAEALRRAISVRIAREVDGLERLVTASMGLITVPRDSMPNATLSDIYSSADRLLYDAKEQGRNRTIKARFKEFKAPKRPKADPAPKAA